MTDRPGGTWRPIRRVVVALSQHDIGSALRAPGFAPVIVSGAIAWAGIQITLIVLTWMTLETTGSAASVGLVIASLLSAWFFLGLPVGSLADSLDRRKAILGADVARVAILLVLALAASGGPIPLLGIVAASFMLGAASTLRVISQQAYVFELVGGAAGGSAIALSFLVASIAGAAASALAGVLLETIGPSGTFLTAGGVVALGTVPLLRMTRVAQTSAAERPERSLRTALTLVAERRAIRLLLALIVLIELFGFSSGTLLPVLAGETYDVGASGLGVMYAVMAVGGALGLLVVAAIGSRLSGTTLLTAASFAYVAGLLVLAVAGPFSVALAALVLVGAAGGGVDALGQGTLQHTVADGERGAAVGIWMFAVGIGPVGHLTVGFLADAIGVDRTLLVQGTALGIGTVIIGRLLLRDRSCRPEAIRVVRTAPCD